MDDRARIQTITEMYNNLTYMDIYGSQVGWVILFTILEIVGLIYFYLKKNKSYFTDKRVFDFSF